MTARLIVSVGPGRSGKTARLLDQYRRALRLGPPGACLWLAPSWLAAEDVRQRILEGSARACFAPGVTTFRRFAERVLREQPAPVRLVTRLMRRRQIGRLIRRQLAAGRLPCLAPAARSGALLDLADAWIGRQQRQEVPAAACSPHDGELLSLYEDYRRHLAEAGLCDVESCFPAALAALRRSWPPWLADLRLAVVDGFNDFTPAQHEILSLLTRRAGQVQIALDGEPEPCRSDVFRRPMETLEQLRRHHAQLEVQHLPPAHGDTPAGLAHVERMLFRPPAELRPARALAGLELLAAAGQCGEIEALAARIKGLLAEGDQGRAVRAHEVAVVFRSLGAVERLVSEVFTRYGIPLELPSGAALGSCGVLAALGNLLRLDLDDWPAGRLLAVLGSRDFRPAWAEGDALAELERAVRGSRTLGGRRELTARCPLLGRLAEAFDALPQQASLSQWAKAWRVLGASLGLPEEESAWPELEAAAGEADRLSVWLGEPAEALDRRQAYAALRELMEQVRRKPPVAAGGVRLLAARSLGGLRVPYLFLAGLTEKSFPAPADPAADDDGDLRVSDEMLLFYSVVSRATRRLFLSYPALDASGQPLDASPYLEEVELACALDRSARHEPVDLSPIPAGEPLSAGDFRVKAVAAALAGNVSLLAGLARRETSPGLADNLLAALGTIHERSSRAGFGPLEGMIGDARVLGRLSSVSGPYGPTELESYATCPFRFLFERVLGLKPLEAPLLQTDFLARGRLLHEVLAVLHRAVNGFCGEPAWPSAIEPADYDRLAEQAVESVLGDDPHSPLWRALAEIDRRVLRGWLAEYRRQCALRVAGLAKQGLTLRPAHFEVDFGREAPGADPLSRSEALEFALGDQHIAICGRIDRIDVGQLAGRWVFSVVDYKSGSAPGLDPQSVLRGLALQLPLYVMAAQDVLLADRGAAPVEAGYWLPAAGGYKNRALAAGRPTTEGVVADPAWEEMRSRLAGTVAALVRGMRRGDFPVWSTDDECTARCALATVCRIQQVRWLEKTWQPADL